MSFDEFALVGTYSINVLSQVESGLSVSWIFLMPPWDKAWA